jgi:hypothetical protein
LIFGARDAVLVDPLMTVSEATALADWHGSARREGRLGSGIMVGRVITEDHAGGHPPGLPGSRTSS